MDDEKEMDEVLERLASLVEEALLLGYFETPEQEAKARELLKAAEIYRN